MRVRARLRPAPPRASPRAATIQLEVHDRQQIEVQLAHELAAASDGARSLMELYVFVPRNVGVASSNYPRDEFYGDLTTFVRVDLPHASLEALAGQGPTPMLFADLRGRLPGLDRGVVAGQQLTVEVKLFGHAFAEAVRDRLDELVAELHALSARPDADRWRFLDEVDRFGELARAALSTLRRVHRGAEPFGLSAPAVLQVVRYTDEYSSMILDGALATLARAALDERALFDGSGFVGRLRQTLARHARAEADYRESRGYLNLDDGTQASPEYFVYRKSLLKKAVQQALYMDTRRIATDTYIRNAVASVAAGIAATWALVAQLPAQLGTLPTQAQTALFALPIVAYMAKDRIKELTKEWLFRRFQAYDTTSAIRVGTLAEAGLGSLAGRVRERMSFAAWEEIPEPIRRLRVARRTVQGADVEGEIALIYRREIDLSGDRPPAAEGLGLRHIIRLNLRHFLTRLDEPMQQACHYSLEDDRFVERELPKVYHLNVITRVTTADQPPRLRRFRVVLNKKRIVRIEVVADPG